ncbi:hypothetical protein L0636_01140 [Halomonas janggokensis]|uniref:Uncharacterized protein n=1 Tax=Vreelandella janggokensis TaxID=370767 RepID=A0ABT4ISA4_9GAMM|nr:hypothetical protein [Halomonas janggokensis]MCZ0926493.1 hypothetical protein [Halomonas janggokensis]MCZ0929031.1 hypothetical protein [Halomonas janggokensis]
MNADTQTAENTQQDQNFNAPAQTIGNGVELASTNVRDQFMQAMTPRTFDDVWRMSQMIAESDLAPKDYKGKPGNVMIAWQTGVELGITSPMQAIQNIAVINGRPTLWGDMMLAICRAAPAWSEADFQEWIEGEGMGMTAHCTVRRRPNGNVAHYTFSAQDAQDASLLGKQGPWQQYKKRMLQMRARSFALRDTFTPELKGIRMAEEERDITPEANAGSGASHNPPAQGRTGTAGKVGDKLAERRQRQKQGQQAREVYETTAEEKAPEDSHGEITADMVCNQISKAVTSDEMAEAIDLARHVPEADQAKVNATYKARIAELKQSAQQQ